MCVGAWGRIQLCDVYLEAIKPIMQLDGSAIANAATKHATQTVLHTCLHYGLRLLHPFMPFVTEELYQRLALLTGAPRTTIMHAEYPVAGSLSSLRSAPAEDAMKVVFKLSASIRELRAGYLKGTLTKHAPKIFGGLPSAPPFGSLPSAPPFGSLPSAPPFGSLPSAPPFGSNAPLPMRLHSTDRTPHYRGPCTARAELGDPFAPASPPPPWSWV